MLGATRDEGQREGEGESSLRAIIIHSARLLTNVQGHRRSRTHCHRTLQAFGLIDAVCAPRHSFDSCSARVRPREKRQALLCKCAGVAVAENAQLQVVARQRITRHPHATVSSTMFQP